MRAQNGSYSATDGAWALSQAKASGSEMKNFVGHGTLWMPRKKLASTRSTGDVPSSAIREA